MAEEKSWGQNLVRIIVNFYTIILFYYLAFLSSNSININRLLFLLFRFKRYCILTHENLLYYNREDSHHNKPQGMVPIVGSTIARLPGNEPIIEIDSPHMEKKKSFFGFYKKQSMHFLCSSGNENI